MGHNNIIQNLILLILPILYSLVLCYLLLPLKHLMNYVKITKEGGKMPD